jgi:hypothetical protein
LKGKAGDTLLPVKLTTTITNIEKKVKNQVNIQLIEELFYFLTAKDTPELPKWTTKGIDKVCRTHRYRGHLLSNPSKAANSKVSRLQKEDVQPRPRKEMDNNME